MDKFVIKKPRAGQSTESSGPKIINITDSEVSEHKVVRPKLDSSIHKRNFQQHWLIQFPWIVRSETTQEDAAFCKVCQEAYTKNLLLFSTKLEFAFITNGFSNWKKAIEKFKAHEKSACHREAVSKMSTIDVNVSCQLSDGKKMEMEEARTALLKILSSLQYLTVQGLAIRGHTDDNSNFTNLLELRSEDSFELKRWLGRDSYTWYSHEICNEMIEIMSHTVLRKLISIISSAKYFAIMVDESADISVKEQVSICFRIVTKELEIEELFVGFYSTNDTKAETLFKIIIDVLHRFNLPVTNCRGQCYDGASNMAGIYSGVQARLVQIEPRAVFIHCRAHSLNLVVQDTVKNVIGCRNALNLIREMIVFVKDSPKRLAFFTQLQAEESKNLRPFCPTRWVIRYLSLSSVASNYSELMEFMLDYSNKEKTDSGAKANGFYAQLQSFDFYFYLSLLIKIFSHIDAVNTSLQKKKPVLSGSFWNDLFSNDNN